ncbi:MAG: enoyl-CoA hydratase [Desulfatitalea sp.]|nr:enoyl-CoA hydratase/isomerase family protein [Desulfatitalea sp.]NNK02552.1 enoyl-CoA hydratase [Desulfatitalea sp.]
MDSAFPNLIWNQQGHVGVLKLNNPKMLNALSMALQKDLMGFLPQLNEMQDLRVVILTGEGKAFCAGGDLKAFCSRYDRYKERGGLRPVYSNQVAMALLDVQVPIIAAVNGHAVGGGLTMALISDLRIASDNARFGAAFVKVGICPEYGSSFFLSRVVGVTKASEMVLTARSIDAREALDIRLVSEVVPEEQLMDRAHALAHEIAQLPPFAVKMAKRVLRHGLESTLQQAMAYEELNETLCFSTADHKEAVSAFLEKRKPEFIGY